MTYLYYPTVVGLPFVADKAILIPTAHDEPYIYFKIYKKIFELNIYNKNSILNAYPLENIK